MGTRNLKCRSAQKGHGLGHGLFFIVIAATDCRAIYTIADYCNYLFPRNDGNNAIVKLTDDVSLLDDISSATVGPATLLRTNTTRLVLEGQPRPRGSFP